MKLHRLFLFITLAFLVSACDSFSDEGPTPAQKAAQRILGLGPAGHLPNGLGPAGFALGNGLGDAPTDDPTGLGTGTTATANGVGSSDTCEQVCHKLAACVPRMEDDDWNDAPGNIEVAQCTVGCRVETDDITEVLNCVLSAESCPAALACLGLEDDDEYYEDYGDY